jgi:alpha/beta superfamily hydrolase
MPVQSVSAGPGDYVETFPDASERIEKAVSSVAAKGYNKIAIVSHSLGGRMVRAYFLSNKVTPVQGWAALSMGFEDFNGVSIPVLDIYAEQDHPPVLNMVAAHKKTLIHPASVQRKVSDTGHFYQGKELEVTQWVQQWLDKAL